MYERNPYRDFEWEQELWAVVNDDGSFAGVPCLSYEEARDLASGHFGSRIFKLVRYTPRPCEEE